MHKRAQQAGCQRGLKQHGAFGRGDFAGVQAAQSAVCRVDADGLRAGQIAGAAHGAEPGVALHPIARAGNGRNRQGVARAGVAAFKAVRMRAEEMALLAGYSRSFAVADAGIALQGGSFAFQRQPGGLGAVEIPVVEQVQVGRGAAGNIGLVGQGGKGVLRGEACNVVSGLHGALNRLRRKVRRAGIAPAVAQVNGYAQRFVAVALHIFQLALAHRNRQAAAFGRFGAGVAGTQLFGVGNGRINQFFKKRLAERKARQRLAVTGCRHGERCKRSLFL